jgi:hypothetical protein
MDLTGPSSAALVVSYTWIRVSGKVPGGQGAGLALSRGDECGHGDAAQAQRADYRVHLVATHTW